MDDLAYFADDLGPWLLLALCAVVVIVCLWRARGNADRH
jgi:hypothetical protein